MSDVIECAFDIGIDHPGAGGVRPCQTEHFFDGVVTSSPRAKPVTDPFEAGFPKWFQGVFHHGLDTAIDNGGNAKRTFPVPLGDIDPTDGVNLVQIKGRSEEHTSELQSRRDLVCRLLLEKKKNIRRTVGDAQNVVTPHLTIGPCNTSASKRALFTIITVASPFPVAYPLFPADLAPPVASI